MQALPAIWEAGNVAEARKLLERQPVALRNFEWHYWYGQTHTEAAVFTLPDADDLVRTRGVGDAGWAFGPDGSRVARVTRPISFQNRASGEHGTLKVWDVTTRKLLLTRPLAEDEIAGFATPQNPGMTLSRDGKVVLVFGPLIDGRSGQRGGFGTVRSNGWVRVLEVDSGEVLFDSRKEPSEGLVSSTAYLSRDGRRFVTHEALNPGGRISHCKVWDLTAAERKPVTIEGANIIGFSPDGSRLVGTVTVDGKRKTNIWDATTGMELLSFDDMRDRTVVFSPKGTLLAGVVVDVMRTENGRGPSTAKLRIYDVHNGKELFAYDLGVIPATGGLLPRILFTSDESQIAFSFTNMQGGRENARTEWSIVDAKTGKLLRTFDDPVIEVNIPFGQRSTQLLSDDGSQIIHSVENVIHTMDLKSGFPVHTLRGCVIRPSNMVALPNGKLRTVEPGGTIRDWNLKPVEPALTAVAEGRRRGPGVGPGRAHCEVSADGAWVARFLEGDNDQVGSVRVWDTAGKQSFELTPPPRDPQPPSSQLARIVILSADGKRAALFRGNAARGGLGGEEKVDPTAGPPPDVTVWDVASQKVLFHRKLSQTEPGRLTALSPDGTILAFAGRSRDGEQRGSKMTLIDIAADGAAKTIEIPGGIGWASFSPDGKRIQCGMGTPSGAKIMIFDTATGKRVCTIEGESLAWFAQLDPETSPVLPKSWSPDGTRLAVAEPPAARIHLFDTATGKLVKTLDAPNRGGAISPNAVLAFSPDGRRLAFVVRNRRGETSTVNVLDTESGKELLSLPLPTRNDAALPSGEPLRFSPDGHRLLHFGPGSTLSQETGTPVTKSFIRVTTWDATPRPEPKES
jgi:WD40 repeat protein